MCIGRVVEISDKYNLKLAIPMTADETVEVQVFVPEGMKNNIKEYLHIGDLVGIKGKLKQDSINHNTIVLADKISFLSKASDEAPDDSEDIDE
jgi:lysyl-tRNA synthetase class II